MPTCSQCNTTYPDGVDVCALDGQVLVNREMAIAASAGAPSSVAVAAAPAEPVPSPSTSAETEATAAFDSMIGATLAGRYRIVRRIGEGGMGAVYEAVHTIIGKRVAVKVLLEKFLAKTDFVARLLQEARLASAIGHEHIVDVTDFGTTDDGRAFVVMEFLDGESLAQLVIREAPLPVERSLRIARQVASALGAAHAKGIVHRDVKPENVYLIRRGDDDFVKVVDFGISKAVKQGQGLGDDVIDYRLTHTGLLLGTPLYMSPEQARCDENLDHRVDIWALGVMLYECLTGEVPFRANNYLGIISQVLTHNARPPSQLRPELGIPEAVESVVMHAMAKDRDQRFAEMADVERDLERLLAGDQNVGLPAQTQVPGKTPPPLTRPVDGRAWVWGAAGVALVAGVIMVLTRPQPTAPRAPTAAVLTPTLPTSPAATATTAKPTLPAPEATRVHESEPSAAAGTSDVARKDLTVQRGRVGNPPGERRVKHAQNGGKRRSPTSQRPQTGTEQAGVPSSSGTEAALRGALPSRSGEGYPEN